MLFRSSGNHMSFASKPQRIDIADTFRFYTNGACTKGKECTFAHVGEPIKKKELCKFIKTHSCRKGDSCVYSHDLKTEACLYFLEGTCTAGLNCKFGHFFPVKEEEVKTENLSENKVEPKEEQEPTKHLPEDMNPFAPLQPISISNTYQSVQTQIPLQSYDVNYALSSVLKNKLAN
jgi:hypothetical protein